MENLDLITSDSSIAHLAGALARPTRVVLKHVPDWRWLLDRSDSPWYPTMRLFRQETAGARRSSENSDLCSATRMQQRNCNEPRPGFDFL
jgi:hypothetical protein